MSKKVLIIKGSPREFGNSATLAKRVFKGAQETGAEVESVYLHSLDIRPCDVCDLCQENGGQCVIEDDMQALYPKIEQADAIIFATPIYWFTISAQMKLFIDRWYAMEFNDDKPSRYKQIGIVLTYGDTDLHTSGGINAIHTFESMFRYLRGKIMGVVHGTANKIGDMEKQPDLLEQAYQLGAAIGADN
jgi:multimeric flavodoxin WrbA